MKKYAKLFLILTLALLLVATLAACNLGVGNYLEPNDKVDPDATGNGGIDPTAVYTPDHLDFKFKGESTSMFKHAVIGQLEWSDISFAVVTKITTKTSVKFSTGKYMDLEEQFIVEESKNAINEAGTHTVFVRYNSGDTVVTGSFDLDMQVPYEDSRTDLTFNLAGGKALWLFGSDANAATVSGKALVGSSISWSSFIARYAVGKDNSALLAWSYIDANGKSQTFNQTSKDIVISENMLFTAVWTSDVITVDFDLNLPSGATFAGGNAPIAPLDQNVAREKGCVSAPKASAFNILNGFTFDGWYTSKNASNENFWNFNKKVGENNFTLYAKWKVEYYDLTVYMTGGQFNDSIQNSVTSGKTAISSSTMFDVETNDPLTVTFTGLQYGKKYSDYYASVCVASKTASEDAEFVNIRIQDIAKNVNKGNYNYFADSWFVDDRDVQFDLDNSKVVGDLDVHINWKVEIGADMNDYYINHLFKDRYTIKADGTVRLDEVVDDSVSDLKIPKGLFIDGKEYVVSEIAAKFADAILTLITVDMSEASGLKIIGDRAFQSSALLEEVILPTENNIESVGGYAFENTAWQNKKFDDPAKNLIINKVLVKYVGDPNVTSIDLRSVPVTSISPYAFDELKNLESVVLPDSVTSIGDYAFNRCKNLENVDGERAVRLESIGANSFIDSKYINQKVEAGGDPNLTIGNIYYRYIGGGQFGKVTISEKITQIASGAFDNASSVKQIIFEDESKIVKIGKHAFMGSGWIQIDAWDGSAENKSSQNINKDQEGFVIVNNILTNYVGSDRSVSIPDTVQVIANGAFDGARNKYVENISVPAGSNIKIEAYAFSGAVSLTGISFQANVINNLPMSIDPLAFSNNDDVVLALVNLYFNSSPLAAIKDGTRDEIKTLHSIYLEYSDKFMLLKPIKVLVNSDIIPVRYFKGVAGGVDADYIRSEWSSIAGFVTMVDGKEVVENALYITYTNGLKSKRDFVLSDLALGYNEEGNLCIHDNSFISKADWYEIEVIKKVKQSDADAVAPYWQAGDSALNGKDPLSAIKIVGLSELYYTSQKELKLDNSMKLSYVDIDGKDCSVLLSDKKVSIAGYTSGTGEHKMTITFDFYGDGKYVVDWAYRVEAPRDETAELAEPVKVLLGSRQGEVAGSFVFKIGMSDGRYETIRLSSQNASLISVNGQSSNLVLKTDEIGRFEATVQINRTVQDSVTCTFNYDVVLIPDQDMFKYNFDTTSKTAVITGASDDAKRMAYLSLPEYVTNPDDLVDANGNYIQYTVVEIADNVFQNNYTLKQVYLPTKIEKIGKRAFAGCTKLDTVARYDSDNHTVIVPGAEIRKVMPSTLSVIGDSAFAGCSSLVTIDFSTAKNLQSIGQRAFEGTAITKIDLSKTRVEELLYMTFYNCANLETISLATAKIGTYETKGTIVIANGVFKDCVALISVENTAQLKNIGGYAFMLCGALDTFVEPSNCTIHETAFEGADSDGNIVWIG